MPSYGSSPQALHGEEEEGRGAGAGKQHAAAGEEGEEGQKHGGSDPRRQHAAGLLRAIEEELGAVRAALEGEGDEPAQQPAPPRRKKKTSAAAEPPSAELTSSAANGADGGLPRLPPPLRPPAGGPPPPPGGPPSSSSSGPPGQLQQALMQERVAALEMQRAELQVGAKQCE